MSHYKVVIPTAGLGSRLGSRSQHINKALLSVNDRPVISYIVEKFSKDITIVVPLGYKATTVRDFLSLAYPDRQFEFVDVTPFEGAGAGLGHTLLSCKHLLQCPFVFCSNDTIVTEEIPVPDCNWMGYSPAGDTEQYRAVRLNQSGQVVEICPKGAQGEVYPYIGLMGVKDYKVFWEAMYQGRDQGGTEIGESYGLRFLLDLGVKGSKFEWFDTGSPASLELAKERLEEGSDIHILPKENEAIWFVDGNVIKFSTDERFIEGRVERAKMLAPYVPQVFAAYKNMYAYKWFDGQVFSRQPSIPAFSSFMAWMDGFWEPATGGVNETHFRQLCMDFYKEKTFSRVKRYFVSSEQLDAAEMINGIEVPSLWQLLAEVDWEKLAEGVPYRIHGDLHFENIVMGLEDSTPFMLLDWRQDFGGETRYGDIYYDLAKLLHGMIVSHRAVSENLFSVKHQANSIWFDCYVPNSLVECRGILEAWVKSKGLDYQKVKLLTALIFLNIAPLHHHPYNVFLFYLGKLELFKALNMASPQEALKE